MKKLFIIIWTFVVFGIGFFAASFAGFNSCGDDVSASTNNTAKKNIGAKVALYPTPAVVVGVEVAGKVNFMLAGHIGIIGHDRVMVSLMKNHHTNIGIREKRKFSISMIDEALLPKADYVGTVSGANVDKSSVFEYHLGDAGTPIIEASPLVMECNVVDIYETDMFENFVCTISNTYVAESVLNSKGQIDYTKLKPVLFEMPTYQYLRTGSVIGRCKTIWSNEKK